MVGGNPIIEGALNDGIVLDDKTPGDGLREFISSSEGQAGKGHIVTKPLGTAGRWLAQAEHSLNITRFLLENGMGAGACFHSEQTAKLALKAFLFGRGSRYVTMHSVRELAAWCAEEDDAF